MNKITPVFVGYDAREDLAYEVCKYSLEKHSPSVEVIPLKQQKLRLEEKYWRDKDPLSSTEFTFTRFLVPALTEYRGWAVFCDCDFVWTVDVEELLKQANDDYAVMVVKHEHTPPEGTKMDGCKQTNYPRKNWSSMILWNCAHPSNKNLTLDVVNEQTGQYLHRFSWLQDHEIGELTPEWNWLVSWNKEPKDGTPKVYHYTEGGPWFKNYRDCEYANVWWDYCVETAENLSKNQSTSTSAITWVTSLSRDYWNQIAELTIPTWKNLPGDIVFVWDDKPADIGFGTNFNFFKEVASPNDPWITEAMGSYKADRFWKKSRVQVWAARKYTGLVIWIDADMVVEKALSKQQAINMLHPNDRVAGTLDCGGEYDIDTGIVAFNTRHENFDNFIRAYSLLWYNGQLNKLPQPYDHYAMSHLRRHFDVATYVPPSSTWQYTPPENINRYAMENSFLKEYFTHHLGLDKKNELSNKKRDENKVVKKDKKDR